MAALLPVRMPQVAQGIPRCLGHNYAALPAVSMRLSLHVALRCKRAQVEVMLRRCVFFQHRNRDTFGGAIPSTFGQDLSVRSL